MSEVKRYTIVECRNDEEFWAKMKEVRHGDYVLYSDYAELEQQLTELKESQKQKQIIRLCQRLDKAEQQKAELIEDLKFIAEQEDAQYINDILKKHGVEI